MSTAQPQVGQFPDRGPAVFAVVTATLCLASVLVLARLYTRLALVRHVSADDYFIAVAWILAVLLCVAADLGSRRGLGRKDADIAPGDLENLRRSEYAFSILYNPALMATKTSILMFYLRLSKNTQKVLRGASWALLVIVNVAGACLTLINIFQCRPVGAAFNADEGGAQCIPLLTEFICSAPVNIVTDLAILALPIPVLTSMRLPPRQKTILVFTFALGVFVAVVDVVRIYYLQQAITFAPTDVADDSSSIYTPDFAFNAALCWMWSAVEVNVSIICANIPTLRPLAARLGNCLGRTRELDETTKTSSGTRDDALAEAALKHDSNDIPRSSGAVAHAPNLGLSLAQGQTDAEREMTAIDFLTMPDLDAETAGPQPASPTQPVSRAAPSVQRPSSSAYFGFVKLRTPISMLSVSATDSFRYCTVVTSLFFLWGFSYGLLNTLNNNIALTGNFTVPETLGLTSAYFGGGYFFGPLLVGEWLLRHDEHARTKHKGGRIDAVGGFKTTFIVGLLIYGTGTIMFWPSAVLSAFGGFFVSSFVVGFGLAVLETAANPFLALCGPPCYEEMRLLLAQGVQGIASVASGVLAQTVFFIDASAYKSTLLDVQWAYLAITLFCVSLALFFYYMPLPELPDRELETAAGHLPVDPKKPGLLGLPLRTTALVLAVAAQWMYVAAQESMSIYFGNILTALVPAQSDSNASVPGLTLSVSNYLAISHTAFAVSRFVAGGLAYFSAAYPRSRLLPKPRTVLLFSCLSAIALGILLVVLRPRQNPNLIAIPIVLFLLAEGPLWPLIFAIGLKGQGKRTKRAAAFLTMGASGPLFWPFVIWGITRSGADIQTAFVVVPVLLLFTLLYPVYLTLSKGARTMTDPACQDSSAIRDSGSEQVEEGMQPDIDVIMTQRRPTGSRPG